MKLANTVAKIAKFWILIATFFGAQASFASALNCHELLKSSEYSINRKEIERYILEREKIRLRVLTHLRELEHELLETDDTLFMTISRGENSPNVTLVLVWRSRAAHKPTQVFISADGTMTVIEKKVMEMPDFSDPHIYADQHFLFQQASNVSISQALIDMNIFNHLSSLLYHNQVINLLNGRPAIYGATSGRLQ